MQASARGAHRFEWKGCRATLLSLLCQAVGSFIARDACVRPDLDHAQLVRGSQQQLDNPEHQVSVLMALQAIRVVQSFTDQEMDVRLSVMTYAVRWG